jgi:hypothetical protein
VRDEGGEVETEVCGMRGEVVGEKEEIEMRGVEGREEDGGFGCEEEEEEEEEGREGDSARIHAKRVAATWNERAEDIVSRKTAVCEFGGGGVCRFSSRLR